MAVGSCEGGEVGGVGQVGADDWCRRCGERSDEYAVGVVVECPGDYWVCRNTGGGGFPVGRVWRGSDGTGIG